MMRKFENVDLIAALGEIMPTNTVHYQSDFEIDKQILHKAVRSDNPEDKDFLWMSRPAGTYCLRERDVFMKDTYAHNTWKFYGEQTRDKILAYAVHLTGVDGEKIRGDLYELDYDRHFKNVRDTALPAETTRLYYEDGIREQPAKYWVNPASDPEYGKLLRCEALPREPEALRDILRQEQHKRTSAVPCDLGRHLRELKGEEKRPSIRRQLEAAKRESAARGTATKSKNNNLEL